MKPKKREKEKAQVKIEENVEADLEKFIQAFESMLVFYCKTSKTIFFVNVI